MRENVGSSASRLNNANSYASYALVMVVVMVSRGFWMSTIKNDFYQQTRIMEAY